MCIRMGIGCMLRSDIASSTDGTFDDNETLTPNFDITQYYHLVCQDICESDFTANTTSAQKLYLLCCMHCESAGLCTLKWWWHLRMYTILYRSCFQWQGYICLDPRPGCLACLTISKLWLSFSPGNLTTISNAHAPQVMVADALHWLHWVAASLHTLPPLPCKQNLCWDLSDQNNTFVMCICIWALQCIHDVTPGHMINCKQVWHMCRHQSGHCFVSHKQ